MEFVYRIRRRRGSAGEESSGAELLRRGLRREHRNFLFLIHWTSNRLGNCGAYRRSYRTGSYSVISFALGEAEIDASAAACSDVGAAASVGFVCVFRLELVRRRRYLFSESLESFHGVVGVPFVVCRRCCRRRRSRWRGFRRERAREGRVILDTGTLVHTAKRYLCLRKARKENEEILEIMSKLRNSIKRKFL